MGVRPPCRGRYHPTFLYESLWNVLVAMILLWVDRRFAVPRGKLFALYVAAYTLGRGVIEALRVDHANHFLGLRLNDWTSLVVFVGALAVLLWPRKTAPDAEEVISVNGSPTAERLPRESKEGG
jgi:prolipoprotein diacylglyceryltransferase